MMRRLTAIVVAASAAALFVSPASAVPTLNGIFPLPDKANAITRGPDGNMWVITDSATDPIARITPDGTVTGFNPADVNTPKGITAGPDGNIWLTQANEVVKVPPANPAGATAITVGAIDGGGPITTGPDGNLWTTSGAKVIKINPANPGVGAVPFTVLDPNAQAIVSGTDGLLWIADFGGGKIVSVTTAGVATPYPAGNMPRRVAAGPGGQIAYTDPLADPQRVSLLKSGGASQPVNTPLADPTGVTFAADGAYWIGQFGTNNVGRLTTDGQYTTFGGFPAASGPREIAAGPNNTVWVTTDTTKSVARITGVDPPATSGDGDTTPPVLSNVSLTNKSFRVGKSATRLSATKAVIGTTIRYTLSEASSVNIVVDKFLPGKRKGKSCVKPTKALIKKHAKNCKRTKTSGTLKRIGAAGPNSEAFSGRMGKRALSPGSYRFTITAIDGAGLASQAQAANFKILKPSK